jgi:predicted dehydrogenase
MPLKPMSMIVLGAGSRGSTYARWAQAHPDRARVVAVAEPDDYRRAAFQAEHGLEASRTHSTWEDLVGDGRLADAAVIATQDRTHADIAVACAQLGYHILLEKPIAPTAAECVRVVDATTRADVMLAVCHVLRYTPLTTALKRLLDAGRIGDVINVQHLEPVGYWHYPHAYVRGQWRREAETSPVLLAKACHDVDWIRHIMGAPIRRVSSFGSLTHFRPENKPAGAADRCLDCAVEPSCPYSARRIYLEVLDRSNILIERITTAEPSEESIRQALRIGPFGECVYNGHNDVNDHQVVNLELADGHTASLTLAAFTEPTWRQTRIFGTRGQIEASGDTIRIFDFITRRKETITVSATGDNTAGGGHGGGDDGLMDAFTRAVQTGDARHIRSGPAESLETHLAVFAAEEARHRGTVETVPHCPGPRDRHDGPGLQVPIH